MKKKLTKALNRPQRYYSRCVRSLLWKRGKSKLSGRGLTQLFDHLDSDAHQPEWQDLWALYSLVKDQKPKLVLEYGSGCSTIILAQALDEIGAGKLITIDANKRWAKHTHDNLPERLKQFVELRVLKPKTLVLGTGFVRKGPRTGYKGGWVSAGKPFAKLGIATLSHPELFDLKPELIYLDGPSPEDVADYKCLQSGKSFPPIVSDILFMYEHLPRPFTLVVDGRRYNCEFINENLPIALDVQYNKHHRQTVFHAS